MTNPGTLRFRGPANPTFAWDGAALVDPAALARAAAGGRVLGALGTPVAVAGGTVVLRDPLGINKLFWAPGGNGRPAFATRLHHLTDAGVPFAAIRAVPPGVAARLTPDGTTVHQAPLAVPDVPAPASIDDAGRAARERLHRYTALIAARHPGPVYVCLSGGLDSAGVLALAREHWADPIAVSFDLDGPSPSEDRAAARRLAGEFGLPLLEVTSDAALLEDLDLVLRAGCDWRDFNVHAGLVNAALGRAIAGDGGRDALVLTGDLMNEFVIDYRPEAYEGRVFYRLPEVGRAVLRDALVRGLESTHREVGVFSAFELPVLQPYAGAADILSRLPAPMLDDPALKDRLSVAMFGEAVPGWVRRRPKTRAQVGGAGDRKGVLGLCVDAGLTGEGLARRFATLHGLEDRAPLRGAVRHGRYRAGLPDADGAGATTPTAPGRTAS